MLEKTLQMVFNSASDKPVTLSIKEPKSSLTEQEVNAAIQTILNQQVFAKDGAAYISIKSAKLVERYVTKYEV